MRWLSLVRKQLRELRRDPWTLALTLVAAPFFVLLYGLFFSDLSGGVYRVAVIGPPQALGWFDGAAIRVLPAASRAEGERWLQVREVDALVILPENTPEQVVLVGDLTNPRYTVAAIIASVALEEQVRLATGREPLVRFEEQPLGASGTRTEFELYVPGLVVFAAVMLLFPAAMTLAREVESGALERLRLTRMTALDLLGAVTVTHALTAAASVLLTFATAALLGFRSQGPLWVAVAVGALTSVSVVGVGLLVACFSRTVTQALVIANFPLFLLMFFSGTIYPVRPVPLFTAWGRTIGLFDLIAPTHAVNALNKVLTMGARLPEVAFELGTLAVLSAVYFAMGVWLFRRRHLTPAG